MINCAAGDFSRNANLSDDHKEETGSLNKLTKTILYLSFSPVPTDRHRGLHVVGERTGLTRCDGNALRWLSTTKSNEKRGHLVIITLLLGMISIETAPIALHSS